MGARSTAASVVRHVGGVAVEAFLVAALVATVALVFSPVYAPAKFLSGTETTLAAKGGHHAAASVAGCSVTPDAVSVGGLYTVSGGGYAPNLPVMVKSQDSVGSQYLSTVTDDTGSFSVRSYASWSGQYNVSVYDMSGPKATLVGSCSFAAD
jgi:hypothetical protein